jgi:GTPase SAR1 family protein
MSDQPQNATLSPRNSTLVRDDKSSRRLSSSSEPLRLTLMPFQDVKSVKINFFYLRGKTPLFFLRNIIDSLELKVDIDELLKKLEETQKVLVQRKFIVEDPPSEEDSGWFVTVDGFLKVIYLFANAEKQIFFTIRLQKFFLETYQSENDAFDLTLADTTDIIDVDEELIQLFKEGVEVKDRKYHLKIYPQCFVGSEAVDWLVNNGFAINRKEAEYIGNKIMEKGVFSHVVNEHKFRDKYYFYRFNDEVADDKSTVYYRYRVVLLGDEGSGKSTLFAGIQQQKTVSNTLRSRKNKRRSLGRSGQSSESSSNSGTLMGPFVKIARWTNHFIESAADFDPRAFKEAVEQMIEDDRITIDKLRPPVSLTTDETKKHRANELSRAVGSRMDELVHETVKSSYKSLPSLEVINEEPRLPRSLSPRQQSQTQSQSLPPSPSPSTLSSASSRVNVSLPPSKKIRFTIWDFAEPPSSSPPLRLPLYYTTHRFFLEELKTLYVIVFNMMTFHTWQLDYWIGSVMEMAPHSLVLLVGTHQDLINSNKLGQIQGFITTRYKAKFPFIIGFLPVSCKSSKCLNKLKELVTLCASRALAWRLKQERDHTPHERLMRLEDYLDTFSAQLKSDLLPFSEFTQVAEKFDIRGSEAVWETLRYFNGVGAAFALSPLPDSVSQPLQRRSSNPVFDRKAALRVANSVTTATPNDTASKELSTNAPPEWSSEAGSKELNNLIVLNPNWFFRLLAAIRLVGDAAQKTAILTAKQISLAWKQNDIPTALHEELLKILCEHYKLLYDIDDVIARHSDSLIESHKTKLEHRPTTPPLKRKKAPEHKTQGVRINMEHRMWIPSLLPKSPPPNLTSNDLAAVYRVYTFDLFPAHLMETVTVRFVALHFLTDQQNVQRQRQQQQHLSAVPDDVANSSLRRKSSLFKPSIELWHGGVKVEGDKFGVVVMCMQRPFQTSLLVKVYGLRHIINVLRHTVEVVNDIIKEEFSSYPVKVLIPCICRACREMHMNAKDNNPDVVCDAGVFSLEECENAVARGELSMRCPLSDEFVRIDSICPDVTMTDLSNYFINYSALEKLEEIGSGAFGKVFRGKYEGEEVAIKELIVNGSDAVETFRDFRREVWLHSVLRHDNIVPLRGYAITSEETNKDVKDAVSSSPISSSSSASSSASSFTPDSERCVFAMVMEYLPYGDLYHLLQKSTVPLPWELRIRIALDIAQGMLFLHSSHPPVLHHDLKSLNVLIKDLNPSAEVVAKIGDFGESRTAFSLSRRGNVINPVWLAPEVMEGTQYTTKSDVYSFGIILWEICSREKPYEEYTVSKSQFLSDLEDAILKGLRPSITNKISDKVLRASTENVCPPEYAKLAQQCWDANPSNRPTFDNIVVQLKEIQSLLK